MSDDSSFNLIQDEPDVCFIVTIYRVHGLRIVIFTDDHEPAHVHVFGDGHAKINLIDPAGGPELVWAAGVKRNEGYRAMQVATEEQAAFLERWGEVHGSADRCHNRRCLRTGPCSTRQ